MRYYPDWLKKKVILNKNSYITQNILEQSSLNTVCVFAKCPNKNECFSNKCATFLILGSICTRNCSFCAVHKGVPEPVKHEEIKAIVSAVKKMGLHYVVITSVTRDDLTDGGAGHFYDIMIALRDCFPAIKIEVLIPDFKGSHEQIQTVLNGMPDVLNHNIETVPSLYTAVRPGADYKRSLGVLAFTRSVTNIKTKSGIMLGLGEKYNDVVQTMRDIRDTGCDILTIGQYLRAQKNNYPVKRYITPEEFAHYKKEAVALGFSSVESGPFVRSSYKAYDCFQEKNEI